MTVDVWRAVEIFASVRTDMEKRMGIAVGFLRGEVIKSINRSQPTRSLSSGARVGLDPSEGGDPPKRVEGDLVRSITTEVTLGLRKVSGRYGSTQTKKAMRLELGFAGTDSLGRVVDQGPRPFLRPPLLENKDKIRKILGAN